MADATVLQIGRINGAGAADALFLKVFGGEVLAAFEEASVVMDKHTVRSISAGKSASFPATWKVAAAYHTPGAEIVGQASNVNERVITIDDLLLASVFLANIEEAKNHFDYRSIYSAQCGRALAVQWSKNVLQVGVLAARAAATVTGAVGGTSLTSTTTLYRTSATDLAAGLFASAQALDEKDIPVEEKRWGFVRPAQYYLLAQNTTQINKDWGGNGAYSDGKIVSIAGIELVKTNHLPITNIASGPTAYQGDFSKTACLIMTQPAVGTVKLMDMGMEAAYDIRRQGTLIVAKYAVGHGILRPECAVELKTTT
jgi:hypothetical protein